MHVRLATNQDKDKWNNFVTNSPQGSFMQSWEWGETQLAFGLPVWRLVVEDEGALLGVALVIERSVLFGRCWLYVPQGPLYGAEPRVWRLLNDKLRELGGGQKAIFVRCDPVIEGANGNDVLLLQSGWQKSEREVQPRHTLVIDLGLSEIELLGQMHQKTRYNIRLAQRKGVTVRFSGEASDIDTFLKLTREVEGRGLFHYHPANYYRTMQEVLGPVGLLEIGVAEKDGIVLAVHILVKYGERMTYAHGASRADRRELMGPNLLQWESIRRAQEQGYKAYDLFGVAADGSESDHPWAGITRFKLGFGGQRIDYIGAYDLVLDQSFYAIYNMARRMRGVLR
ncbi:MAG: hypothetical protein A3E37_01420 [Candidatus Andersenbacteria bacterium RIFCSPHIGHO2_12_FULL_46_9]|nr:MAG: Methicillin resistance protein [Parcubacteria group bacterium GW2011_GWA2_45_14]OGY35080.1 MAG: hypothetical protein A3B76_04515 [Candidatus Andersenbacteria bacterium RIFCSPHIGHO2_02_FULL_46_16]OGY37011.1 MAG: hypothetical protein A3I08_02265 [Candidatus Andersenbacteria bacterium RIFCSPLOWO2_02_FULL_46_11]OGY38256.1 MAG: hypothetical protein A3E37_01420 [Candidatus Andersenbacteria bacterium RIFCSPHIGHO2_12_FULL_46_9]HBE90423.1 hypothetical protein [Candidatus Andersenbacteria bacteri